MQLFDSCYSDVVTAMEKEKYDSWSSFNPGEMNMVMTIMPQEPGSELQLILEWDDTEF